MLRKILSISGKPGLFELISYGKNIIVVENLESKKRIPAYTRDRIVSLGDISMYTEDEEVLLGEVFKSVFEKYEGKKVENVILKDKDSLAEFFAGVLPTYDRDRVHNDDIKKVIKWYNILVGAGFTEFTTKDEPEETESAE